jgi:hypothetical protein
LGIERSGFAEPGMGKCCGMPVNPGWAGIIRIYKIYFWCTIVARLTWWIILLLIRFEFYYLHNSLHRFGENLWQTLRLRIGLAFLGIFLPILGFRSAQHQ